MNFATIKYYDIANGPGVRTSVFVSGCRHHCPGCFNEVAWDFGYGKPFDKATRNEVFASCQPDYIAGISLLGGAPMEPENQRELLPFVRNFKALYPKKTVWCYSGYTWEQLTGAVPCPPSASGAAGTSGCWMCPSPLPPGSLSGGRTSRSFPPIRCSPLSQCSALPAPPPSVAYAASPSGRRESFKGRALGKLQKHCKIAMQSSVIKSVPFSTSDAGIVENETFYF